MTKTFFIKLPDQNQICCQFNEKEEFTLKNLIFQIKNKQLKFPSHYYIVSGNILIDSEQKIKELEDLSTINFLIPLMGGKGGFGQNMRSQASKSKNINNFDSSRDLQGRRIKYVQNEQKLIEFLKKKKEEDKIIKIQMKKYQEIEETLKHGQLDIKLNQEYKDKLENLEKNMSYSVKQGLKLKRKRENQDNLEIPIQKIQQTEQNIEEKQIVKKVCANNDINVQSNQEQNILKDIVQQIETKQTSQVENNNFEEEKLTQNSNKESQNIKEQNSLIQNDLIQQQKQIDLNLIQSLSELEAFGDDILKTELKNLGLKAGGTVKEKAQRLFDIKLDPSKLFHPKYIAKK